VNSGRWLQWHWAGGTPPGDAKSDVWIMAQIFLRLKALYQKEGGTFPIRSSISLGPIRMRTNHRPRTCQGNERLCGSGRFRSERFQQENSEQGKQLPGFAALRDDGTTASGNWIFSGCFTEAGNMMARRDNGDPDDTGAYPNGRSRGRPIVAFSITAPHATWTASLGIPRAKLIAWDGSKWTGYDVPDIPPASKPRDVGPSL